jgi:uncharacterized protein
VKITPDRSAAGPIVTGFGPRGFRLGEDHARALLLTAERGWAWEPPPLAELDAAALAELVADGPEFVLIGTGPSLVRPPPELTRDLERQGIGVEAMDSRAAARAWGVLRGEGRRIAAALYPID